MCHSVRRRTCTMCHSPGCLVARWSGIGSRTVLQSYSLTGKRFSCTTVRLYGCETTPAVECPHPP
jgi:hypothetical protein